MSNIITLSTQNQQITFQRAEDGYINATALCQNAGKQIGHYNANQQTKDFLVELANTLNIPVEQLVKITKGGNKQQEQGTWVHPLVFKHLFLWLSNALSEKDIKTIQDLLQVNGVSNVEFFRQTRQEIEFIDTLLKILEPFNFECVKQYQVLNYRIDLYIKDLNIAVEYDEGHHSSQAEEDDIRQITIEKQLGCKFIRVSNKDSHLWNCGYIMKRIFAI
jgi:very-short-patch-repair endonuclease